LARFFERRCVIHIGNNVAHRLAGSDRCHDLDAGDIATTDRNDFVRGTYDRSRRWRKCSIASSPTPILVLDKRALRSATVRRRKPAKAKPKRRR
jgi:hypothetical protein